MSESRSATFSEVESIRCPKCASGPSCKCWIMAGTGITGKTKDSPHMERASAYFDLLEAVNEPTR